MLELERLLPCQQCKKEVGVCKDAHFHVNAKIYPLQSLLRPGNNLVLYLSSHVGKVGAETGDTDY